MKPNTSFEQGTCAMLMMALQEGHTPVRSKDMAQVLGVSDSYLKKTLRKLVVAELIESEPLRGGGFTLAKAPKDITLADAYGSLCGKLGPESSGLPERVFVDKAQIKKGKAVFHEAMERAEDAYMDELRKITLLDLINPATAKNGAIDWHSVALGKESL